MADLSNRISRDVRIAWLNANTAFQRVSLDPTVCGPGTTGARSCAEPLHLGLSSIVELSQAQLNLTSAQIESATARYDYQAQRSLVDYQTGPLR